MNTDLFVTFLVCHLIGDFLLQNDWMQLKGVNTARCLVHVSLYCLPFTLIAFWGYKGTELLISQILIFITHFLQDRFKLHLYWMRLIRQSPPEKWPLGPFVCDQVWHIVTLFFIAKYLC